jgi:hypothetical protein
MTMSRPTADRPPRLRRRAAALGLIAALALALAACGGSGKKTTPTTASPLTTTQAVDTNFTGAGSGEFCQMAKTLNTNPSRTTPNASTAQIRSNLEAQQKAVQQAVDAAPGEIKPDVKVIADGFSTVVAAVAQADYDFSKVSPDALKVLQSPEFSNSAARLQAYMAKVCHVTK